MWSGKLTVKIHLLSDLHSDIDGNDLKSLPRVDADVTIVAGDAMAPGHLAIRRVRELLPEAENLIYVPGNHDYYSFFDKKRPELGLKTTWEAQRFELMPRAAEDNGLVLLDDKSVEIDGVTFIGATLWSDMRCRPFYMSHADAVRDAMRMNDYRVIKRNPGRGKDRLKPATTIDLHKASVDYISACLQSSAQSDTVVVTHHAPSPRSLRNWQPERPQAFGELDWCYASDLEFLMQDNTAPALWLHGHIHANRDYQVGGTRVVCNPRGYPGENADFDPGFIVELEPRFRLAMGIQSWALR
jgi:Icc-related predicted phosphoesterase